MFHASRAPTATRTCRPGADCGDPPGTGSGAGSQSERKKPVSKPQPVQVGGDGAHTPEYLAQTLESFPPAHYPPPAVSFADEGPSGSRNSGQGRGSESDRSPAPAMADPGREGQPSSGQAGPSAPPAARRLQIIETKLSQRAMDPRGLRADRQTSPSAHVPEDYVEPERGELPPAPDCAADETYLCLRVIAAPAGGKVGAVRVVGPGEGEECKVGRHWRCGMVLDDGEVSSEHLLVRWDDTLATGWGVTDLGSLNGTRRNGEVISSEGRVRGAEVGVAHGDRLLLASGTLLECLLMDEEAAEEAELAGGEAGRARGGLGGKGAAMLRKAQNQGATMRRRISSTEEGYPFLEAGAQREGFPALVLSEDSGAQTVLAPRLGAACAMRIRQGITHARDKRPCEDQVSVAAPASAEGPPAAVLAIFDGHFGTKAGIMAKHQLAQLVPGMVGAGPAGADGGYGDGMRGVLASIEELICAQCEEGCTATVVPVWEDGAGTVRVQCANVGDSMAVFCPLDPARGGPVALSENHRVDQDAEFERIAGYNLPPERLGGYDRGHTRLLGFQLARCLGDAMFKSECPAIVAEPGVSGVLAVPEGGAVVVVASDGLWDGMSLERAAEVVRDAVTAEGVGPGSVALLGEVRDELVEMALEERSKDDISLVVALLHPALRGEDVAAAVGAAARQRGARDPGAEPGADSLLARNRQSTVMQTSKSIDLKRDASLDGEEEEEEDDD